MLRFLPPPPPHPDPPRCQFQFLDSSVRPVGTAVCAAHPVGTPAEESSARGGRHAEEGICGMCFGGGFSFWTVSFLDGVSWRLQSVQRSLGYLADLDDRNGCHVQVRSRRRFGGAMVA